MGWQIWSIVPVWATALAGAVLVGLLVGDGFLEWLPLVLAGSLLLGFAIQLAIQRKEGLVVRLVLGAAGALVILGGATAVLALLGLSGSGLAA